jgi:predicted component of type VI protein secretion system
LVPRNNVLWGVHIAPYGFTTVTAIGLNASCFSKPLHCQSHGTSREALDGNDVNRYFIEMFHCRWSTKHWQSEHCMKRRFARQAREKSANPSNRPSEKSEAKDSCCSNSKD